MLNHLFTSASAVSLIASFCPQIKSPIFSAFIHIYPCISGDPYSICQFVCIPNSTTAEPDYHGHPAKPKERMGWKSFPGCWETIELANQIVANTTAKVFRNRANLVRTQNSSPPLGRPENGARSNDQGYANFPANLEVGIFLILRAPGKNLETISHPFSFWVSLGVRGSVVQRSGRTVRNTNELPAN